jgi:hypothetical protein
MEGAWGGGMKEGRERTWEDQGGSMEGMTEQGREEGTLRKEGLD